MYVKGFVIEKMDSRPDWGDTEYDYVLKRLFVKAKQNEIRDWELVAYLEVETIDIEDGGEDSGSLEPPVEVYRMPFPYDQRTRIEMLRRIKKQPKFFVA